MQIAFVARRIISNLFFKSDSALNLNKELVVLCFHSFSTNNDRYSIDPLIFENQIKNILKYSTFIDLFGIKKVLDGKNENTSRILITIDDGFEDVLNILPITKKYNIPVILFVMSNRKKVNRCELGNEAGLLSWNQIKYLQNQGWVIGCHSATHSNFSELSISELKTEILQSKKDLESRLHLKINAFAYPKGIVNQDILTLVRDAGYEFGFTIDTGAVNLRSNKYLIPRTIIDKTHSPSEFPAIYTKSWLMFRKMTNEMKLWEKFLQ